MDAHKMATMNLSQSVKDDLFETDFDPVEAMKAMEAFCSAFFQEHPTPTQPGASYCNSTFDSFSCWPTTRTGYTATIKCPDISIANPKANATKECLENATWAAADYKICMSEVDHQNDLFQNVYPSQTLSVRIIYDVGFAITTVFLIIALAIFVQLKSLRCLRNSIHCNLILAFIFSNITWLIIHNTLNKVYVDGPQLVCKLLVVTTTYFHTTTFYWMFVEGVYLFTIVVWAFSAQKLRLWYYLIVGWAVPFAVTVIWTVIKENLETGTCWLHTGDYVDYIINAPVLLLLASNLLFMVTIIWVLVTKMKASNSLENLQTRKAVKATVVLVPLLGLTYIMFLRSPFDHDVVNSVFQHINAILQSSQGLLVALFYCFLNGEVRSVLRQKFHSIQDSRSLSRYTKSALYSSPRRSSCFISTGNGKTSNARGSANSKVSRSAENETEASALMMDRVGVTSEVSQFETV